jgi:DNA-binding transcriptional ArsR family regulator
MLQNLDAIKTFTEYMKALANEARLLILIAASRGEVDIVGMHILLESLDIHMDEVTLRHHADELLRAGLLVMRRSGRRNFYTARPETLAAVEDLSLRIYGMLEGE